MLPFHTAASCRFVTNMERGWLHIYIHMFLHTHTHTHLPSTAGYMHKYFLIHTLSAHCRSIIYIGGEWGLLTHTRTHKQTRLLTHILTHTQLPLTTGPWSILATRTGTTHARTQTHTSPLSHTHLHLLPTAGSSSISLAWTTAMRTHINTHTSPDKHTITSCAHSRFRHLYYFGWRGQRLYTYTYTHTYWRTHTPSTHCRFLINLVDFDNDDALNPTEVTHTATLRWLRARTCVWRCIYGAGSSSRFFFLCVSLSFSVSLFLSVSRSPALSVWFRSRPQCAQHPKVTHAATHAARWHWQHTPRRWHTLTNTLLPNGDNTPHRVDTDCNTTRTSHATVCMEL